MPRGGPSVDMRPSNVNVRIFVNRQNDLQVFETEPDTADPNLFYDSSEMYKTGIVVLSSSVLRRSPALLPDIIQKAKTSVGGVLYIYLESDSADAYVPVSKAVQNLV